jgi:glutathione S-transferase
MSKDLRLITIPVSHYCEKVRWALEYLRIPFQELPHMPPFHSNATKKYGGTTTPLLATGTAVIKDSTDILHYLDTLYPGKLYPNQPELRELIDELEALFNDKLGVHTRRWGYSYVLTPKLLYPRWTMGVPIWEKWLFPIVFPKVSKIVQEKFDINATSASASYQEIQQVFDRVNQVLADGRKYLLGDQFSAIDITFAALAAPVLQAPEHLMASPIDSLPAQMQTEIRQCQATPAGKLGLRLYRDHRYNPSTSNNWLKDARNG